jgi:hypothetical protein
VTLLDSNCAIAVSGASAGRSFAMQKTTLLLAVALLLPWPAMAQEA